MMKAFDEFWMRKMINRPSKNYFNNGGERKSGEKDGE